MPEQPPSRPMDGFLSVRFRVGDAEIIEVDTGSDVWFAVKMLRAAADGLSEWAEAQEANASLSAPTAQSDVQP